jgi:hypothetical protein
MKALFMEYLQKEHTEARKGSAMARLKDLLHVPEWLDMLKCSPGLDDASFTLEHDVQTSSPCHESDNELESQFMKVAILDDSASDSSDDVVVVYPEQQPKHLKSNFIVSSAVAQQAESSMLDEPLGSVRESSGIGSAHHTVSFAYSSVHESSTQPSRKTSIYPLERISEDDAVEYRAWAISQLQHGHVDAVPADVAPSTRRVIVSDV